MKDILVFRRGLLGDNLVAAPALRCLRQAYPRARLVLVSEAGRREQHCWGREVFGSSGLVDEIVPFAAYNSPTRCQQIIATLSLYRSLRVTSWGLGVALDTHEKVHWEPTILRLLGAEIILRPEGNGAMVSKTKETRPAAPHIADRLIEVLRPLGLALPGCGQGSTEVNIASSEISEVDHWLQRTGAGEAPQPWIALGPWTNMPAKQWPPERFTEVVGRLREAAGGTPFVFGGPQDQVGTRNLIQAWGFGIPVAGSLNVRQGIALLQRCRLFIGNDSGTMHMAVSAGIPCVAIFSGRDQPGLWDPYGQGHLVLRRPVPCEGCMLKKCGVHNNKCLKAIAPEEVVNASLSILSSSKNKKRGRK